MRGEPWTVAEISSHAREVNRTSREVDATFKLRDGGADFMEQWRAATVRHRQARAAMYPPELEHAIAALGRQRAPADALERTLVFLEADPWCFRSGYVKQEILRRLARCELSHDQRERLADALLACIDAGDRRELPGACKAARRKATPRLRAELKTRLGHEDRDVARRALLMLSFLRGPNLSPGELDAARAAILDGIHFGHGGRMSRPGWLAVLARRFWSDDWLQSLVELAREGRYEASAEWLLAYAPIGARGALEAAFVLDEEAAGP